MGKMAAHATKLKELISKIISELSARLSQIKTRLPNRVPMKPAQHSVSSPAVPLVSPAADAAKAPTTSNSALPQWTAQSSHWAGLNSTFRKHAWPLVLWLRANPLGPALTVCLTGLFSVFALPQLTVWMLPWPKLILTQVLLSAPFVPYSVYRVHQVPWRPLVGLWAGIYIAALARTPVPLKGMQALALSAHMSSWFMWGFFFTAVLALYQISSASKPTPAKTPGTAPKYDISSQAG